MTYAVHVKRSAAKALQTIARDERLRLIEAIDRLADNPGAGSVLKGEFSGLRRLRSAMTASSMRCRRNCLRYCKRVGIHRVIKKTEK